MKLVHMRRRHISKVGKHKAEDPIRSLQYSQVVCLIFPYHLQITGQNVGYYYYLFVFHLAI